MPYPTGLTRPALPLAWPNTEARILPGGAAHNIKARSSLSAPGPNQHYRLCNNSIGAPLKRNHCPLQPLPKNNGKTFKIIQNNIKGVSRKTAELELIATTQKADIITV